MYNYEKLQFTISFIVYDVHSTRNLYYSFLPKQKQVVKQPTEFHCSI